MNFILIANAWAAGIANPTSKHRIATELVRRGHRVLWVEGAGMRRPSLASSGDRARIFGKLKAFLRGIRAVPAVEGTTKGAGAVYLYTPLLIPLPQSAVCRWWNAFALMMRVRGFLFLHGWKGTTLILYVPILHRVFTFWRGPKVYHCVDRWDAFTTYDADLMRRADRACCRSADLVIASSRDLETRCRAINPRTVRINHGVDHEHFRRALSVNRRPADLPQGSIIGFFGLISEWIDQDLLVALAGRFPKAQVVLIGTADVATDRLAGRPNIHLLGPRPFAELPDYAASFTVGVIPFEVNELTRAVNPIKLREMLSAGCPVVTTALPEATDMKDELARRVNWPADALQVARDRDEFCTAVGRFLVRPLSGSERARISGSMAGETWAGMVEKLLFSCGGYLRETRK